jgi:hypothetical protein
MKEVIYCSKSSDDKFKNYSVRKFKEIFGNKKEGSKNVGITVELADGSTKRFRWDRMKAFYQV